MRVAITGSNGFLGSRVASEFSANGWKVIELVRQAPKSSQVLMGDLCAPFSEDFLQGVDVLVHCAARVHVMNEEDAEPLEAYRQVNVKGTLDLAIKAKRAGVRRFIFVSSIKVNGEGTAPGCPYTADDVPAPEDPYGVSKAEAEHKLFEMFSGSSMEIVVIRPTLVYGAGVKANFAALLKSIKDGIPLPLRGINSNLRSFSYIGNLVDLIRICATHKNAANQIFLVSDGEDVSTKLLLERMSKACGRKARLFYVPTSFINFVGKLVGKPNVTSRLCGSLQVDIQKTKDLLGWEPKFSMDDGLREAAFGMIVCDKN